jgi:formylglycine-generating enzyme required for sulfatase activity
MKANIHSRNLMSALHCLLLMFITIAATANNITISNVSLSGQNAASKSVKIQFTVSWENSFRVSTGPANWDAAWVFVKYRVAKVSGGDAIWRHAVLNTTGQFAPAGSVVTPSAEGALVYRSANGTGTFTVSNAQLGWNYGTHIESGTTDLIDDDDAIELQVFAIEMVYVPGAVSFNVGGGGGINAFPSTTISTANASLIGSGYPTGGTNTNAAFPNGYNAFYCMKYEISQQQYVDFLNTLTYAQQQVRTGTAPNAAAGTGALVSNNASRNGIDIKTPGVSATTPAVYACNLDADAIFDEANDGQWLACNFLGWGDLAAYLDWSGLSPMTELEYEKACRGNLPPVPGEYAWGTLNVVQATSIVNPGTSTESYGNVAANACYGMATGVPGPLRVGCFAGAVSSRALSGATYYGIMEMSGNVWERTVTAGTSPAFTGLNGNGSLNPNGNADVTAWPANTAGGIGFRGSAWYYNSASMQVSDRVSAAYVSATRSLDNGGRGVRR